MVLRLRRPVARLRSGLVRERLAYRYANPSMATNVAGRRGKEERKFNEGLACGYGHRHSAAQAETIRAGAFAALTKADRSIDTIRPDVIDVWKLASVLAPRANALITEAERRKERRLMEEWAKNCTSRIDPAARATRTRPPSAFATRRPRRRRSGPAAPRTSRSVEDGHGAGERRSLTAGRTPSRPTAARLGRRAPHDVDAAIGHLEVFTCRGQFSAPFACRGDPNRRDRARTSCSNVSADVAARQPTLAAPPSASAATRDRQHWNSRKRRCPSVQGAVPGTRRSTFTARRHPRRRLRHPSAFTDGRTRRCAGRWCECAGSGASDQLC